MVVLEFPVFLVCTALLGETVETELEETKEKRGREKKERQETSEEWGRRERRGHKVLSVPKETAGKWEHVA